MERTGLVALIKEDGSPDNASKISFTATLRTDADIMLSSWAKVAAYEWEFGMGLGKTRRCEAAGIYACRELGVYDARRGRMGMLTVAINVFKGNTEWNKLVGCIG